MLDKVQLNDFVKKTNEHILYYAVIWVLMNALLLFYR